MANFVGLHILMIRSGKCFVTKATEVVGSYQSFPEEARKKLAVS